MNAAVAALVHWILYSRRNVTSAEGFRLGCALFLTTELLNVLHSQINRYATKKKKEKKEKKNTFEQS